MPVPSAARLPHKGPSLEQLQMELSEYMTQLTAIHRYIYLQEKAKEPKADQGAGRQVVLGDQVNLKVFRRKWHEPWREGPYTVVRVTPTAVQLEGSTTWYHLSHCTKVPTETKGSMKLKTIWKTMWLLVEVMCSLMLQPTDNVEAKETVPRRPSQTLKTRSTGEPLELQPPQEAPHDHDQDKYDATIIFPIHTVSKPMPAFSAQIHYDPQPLSQEQGDKRGKRDLHTMWKWRHEKMMGNEKIK